MSCPWVGASIDGIAHRLELSTRFHGIILYGELLEPEYPSVNVTLSNVTATDVVVKMANMKSFERPWNATGMLGVGLVSSAQHVWPFLGDKVDAVLKYHGMNFENGEANATFEKISQDMKVSWSESMNNVHDFYYKRKTSFTLHNASVCGVSLTKPASSYWSTYIDFQSPCLVLPQEFYNTLLAWAPLQYNTSANITQLKEGTQLTDLPAITFQTGFDSPVFSLSLASLVLANTTSTTPQLCIQKAESIINLVLEHQIVLEEDDIFTKELGGISYVPNMYQSPIVLGAMAVQHLDLYISDYNKQIGFGHINPSIVVLTSKDFIYVVVNTSSKCNVPVTCTGEQQYIKRLNLCKDPDCGQRYYRTLDYTTKTCDVSAIWQWLAFAIITVFVVIEIYVERVKSRLADRILSE
ncbi:hypothetical protein THRCLA_02410 [Thraustotheca clavata]|uniref:Uncharacterized protein n=1 Tax=Thraustotheca clavata TaxID=74557 RepID=A0A1W0A611_9STRA|nr:hypothetical protein THRCLA_02410 [Thraustotheca clavata]